MVNQMLLKQKKSAFCLFFLNCFIFSSNCFAEVKIEKLNAEEEMKVPEEPFYKDPPSIKLTSAEKKAVCKKYRGKYINYSGEVVFKVTGDCHREKLDVTTVQNLLKKKYLVIDVDERVIQALPLLNKTFNNLSKKDKTKIIRDFNGKCITSSHTVYLLEKGLKRPFPDWVTVQERKCKLHFLSDKEILSIPEGKPISSFIDKSYRSDVERDDPEQIPLYILCKRLDNKLYSYYTHEERYFSNRENTNV